MANRKHRAKLAQAIHTRKLRRRERNAQERTILKQALGRALRQKDIYDGIATLAAMRAYPELRSRLTPRTITRAMYRRRVTGSVEA